MGQLMPYEDEEPPFAEPDSELDQLARDVIDAAIEVHRCFGPGVDEAIYEAAMCRELALRGMNFECQVPTDVFYKGELIGRRRIDLIVERRLVVELKAVESIAPLHKAQLPTYLKLKNLTLGLLINFNVILLKDGIHRIIHH